MRRKTGSEFSSKLGGATVAVTGGAGFIGSHLVDACLEAGARVRVLDDLSHSTPPAPREGVEFRLGDVRDASSIKWALRGADFIMHHAAIASVPECNVRPHDAFNVNAFAFANLLESVRKSCGHARLLLASSAAVYGAAPKPTLFGEGSQVAPHSVYAASKYAAECMANAYGTTYGTNVRIVRYTNVYGPRQPRYIMYDMYNKIVQANGSVEVVGSGNQQRDFLYVDDAVHYTLAVLTADAGSDVVNVGSGTATRILDVVAALCRALGRADVSLSCTGKSWPGDVDYLLCDVGRIRCLAGTPRTALLSGIASFVAWAKNRPRG